MQGFCGYQEKARRSIEEINLFHERRRGECYLKLLLEVFGPTGSSRRRMHFYLIGQEDENSRQEI
jgi:hypothetical protein